MSIYSLLDFVFQNQQFFRASHGLATLFRRLIMIRLALGSISKPNPYIIYVNLQLANGMWWLRWRIELELYIQMRWGSWSPLKLRSSRSIFIQIYKILLSKKKEVLRNHSFLKNIQTKCTKKTFVIVDSSQLN